MQGHDFVAGLRSGNPASMKIIMDLTRVRLMYYALNYTTDRDEIDDIIMKAYRELWSKRDKIDTQSDIRAMLYVSVRSGCLNYQKQVQRKEQHHQQLGYTQKLQEASPAEQLEYKNLLTVVFAHFDELEPRCKEVLKLIYLEGLTDKEIAERLNMKLKTVQSKKSEGISKLKQVLSNKNSGNQIYSALLLMLIFSGGISQIVRA